MTDQAQADAQPDTAEEALLKKRREDAERLAAEIAATGQSRFIDPLRNRFSDIDPTSVSFLAGVSRISDIATEKKRPQELVITCSSGNKVICYNVVEEQPNAQPRQTEYIGLTAMQAQLTPLDDSIADDIMATAAMRGWSDVNVHGTPQERDMLWLAAQKHGLNVKGFSPSAETLAKWEGMKDQYAQQGGQNAETAQQGPGVSSSFMTAPKQPESAFMKEDIVDAEFEEIAPAQLAAPQKRLPPPPSNG